MLSLDSARNRELVFLCDVLGETKSTVIVVILVINYNIN